MLCIHYTFYRMEKNTARHTVCMQQTTLHAARAHCMERTIHYMHHTVHCMQRTLAMLQRVKLNIEYELRGRIKSATLF